MNLPMNASRIIWRAEGLVRVLASAGLLTKNNWERDSSAAAVFGVGWIVSTPHMPQVIRWTMPCWGELKLNTDGCYKTSMGEAAGGGILRAHDGQMVSAFDEYYGKCSSFVADWQWLKLYTKDCNMQREELRFKYRLIFTLGEYS
ncbi:uncharacterized protein Fot_24660 [Forsythia ovata]|uniref:RNase H type-1 domain-containing protein n=1 Tax=Forsythia ovata TaxID=205694 RepID=A0ABD1U6V7_9LAMI